MSDVHTLQDSKLYGFWSPKQVYYMWQWKVEIVARNWGWSFKHETSTSHLGRGQLREAQNFFPAMVTSLVTWSHLAKSLVRCQCLETALGNMEGLKLNSCCRYIDSENGLNTLTGSLWRVFHEVATWNHMKENWQKIHEQKRIRISRVFWSLSSSSAAWRHCGWTAPWRRQREFWGSWFPISTECVNVC